jgi:hypothetical protein
VVHTKKWFGERLAHEKTCGSKIKNVGVVLSHKLLFIDNLTCVLKIRLIKKMKNILKGLRI